MALQYCVTPSQICFNKFVAIINKWWSETPGESWIDWKLWGAYMFEWIGDLWNEILYIAVMWKFHSIRIVTMKLFPRYFLFLTPSLSVSRQRYEKDRIRIKGIQRDFTIARLFVNHVWRLEFLLPKAVFSCLECCCYESRIYCSKFVMALQYCVTPSQICFNKFVAIINKWWSETPGESWIDWKLWGAYMFEWIGDLWNEILYIAVMWKFHSIRIVTMKLFPRYFLFLTPSLPCDGTHSTSIRIQL